LKQVLFGLIICAFVFFSGCEKTVDKFSTVAPDAFLVLDFNEGEALRYRFVSERTIQTDWNPAEEKSDTRKISTESVDMVLRYEPVEVDPYGISKIRVYCESVRAVTSGQSRKDAVETIAGKSFVITVSPDGKIHDKSQLIEVAQQAGKAAFRRDSNIKEPDLVEDFTATQWFLWDSLSSIEKPAAGLKIGQAWKSNLSVPTSMVLRPVRDVTYRLSQIKQDDKGRIAVIDSEYAFTRETPDDWPALPWSGRFQLAGQFGFFLSVFQGLHVNSLEGQGKEFFNIDSGRVENYEQEYKFTLKPGAVPLAGTDPLITVNQRITMQLLEN